MNRNCASAKWQALLAAAILLIATHPATAVDPQQARCVAPAKPGGGFDLTCNLVRKGLQATGQLDGPLEVLYMPGAIGALAYNVSVTRRADHPNTIVAFSSGTLLNLAQGNFGRYDEHAVRWLAGIGIDHGMIAVRADSRFKTLDQLMTELKREPRTLLLGAGGNVGSQDWMKAALIARAARIDPMTLRYVSFEGGGETLSALLSGQIHAACGDISEVSSQLASGKIRILAIFSDKRLPGRLAGIPTAREQGADILWPVIRGFYMGPKVPESAYQQWRTRLEKMLDAPQFDQLRRDALLLPLDKTGPDIEALIEQEVARYRTLSREIGLIQ